MQRILHPGNRCP